MSKEELGQYFADNWNEHMTSNPMDVWLKIESGEITTQQQIQEHLVEL